MELNSGLLEEGGGVLLSGTKLFPSSFANSWNEVKLFAIGFLLFSLSLLLLLTGAMGILTVCTFLSSFVLLFVGLLVQRAAFEAYSKSVANGTWQEGVLVFPTGEVVVRLHRPGTHVDREFGSGSITQISATNHGLEIQSRGELACVVNASQLAHPPAQIAQEMKERLGL
ncbi:hypothetical protein BASA81_007796 [Batrachochytrium salamandrivorans]|nr:hypothetical protein BASA81_007796 [Batrachochytrium salamandrivorans]